MSLTLLQSFVSEITANDAKMAQNKKDIDDIKSQLMIMNEYIKELKDFDVKEEKEEEEIREDIKELVAMDELQVAADAEAAVIIAGLQAEILALKAANNVQDDGDKIIKKDVKVLQVEVKDLKSKEEMEKFDEIANLELMITRLKEELVALNGGEPILNGGEKPEVGDAAGVAIDTGEITLDLLGA